jgi:hypothetical protein
MPRSWAVSSAPAISRASRTASAVAIGPQRSSVDVFEHQVVWPDIVNLADVRVIQRGNRTLRARIVRRAPVSGA